MGRQKKDGTIYVNLTRNFPLRSLDGMAEVFILYNNWTTNAILADPIANAQDKTVVETFKDNVQYLAKCGYKPTFNIIDNVASKAVQAYLKKEDVGIQLV